MLFEIVAYRHDVKLDVQKQGETFKPGLNYNVVVALRQMDDTPVKATVPRRVQVIHIPIFRYRSPVKANHTNLWLVRVLFGICLRGGQ